MTREQKREQIIEIFEKWQDYVIDPDVYNEITDAILVLDEQKERESPEEILDKYLKGFTWPYWSKENVIKAMEEYAAQSRQPEKVSDEEIVASIPYPNPISKHQSDINIGWVRCRKAMRDNPEQFRDK